MAGARNQTIDALKGIAILIVMAGHVISWNHMEDGYLYDAIKALQMPLFMMVSGYLCGIGRRVGSLEAYKQVVKKRALSYLVPFFFWIMIQHPMNMPTAITETLFQLDKGLWFLMTLFLLQVMTYTAQLAAARAEKQKKAVFWLVYLGMALFVVLETLMGWEFLSPGLTRLYLPFYLAGYLAGENRERLAAVSNRFKGLLCVLALGGFIYLAAACDLLDVGSLWKLGRQMAASFLGCYAAAFLTTLWKDGRGKRFMAWLGGYTLEIYVLHFHFATVLNQGKTYTLFSLEGMLFALASFVVMSLITAVIIAVTKRFALLDFLMYGKRQDVRGAKE